MQLVLGFEERRSGSPAGAGGRAAGGHLQDAGCSPCRRVVHGPFAPRSAPSSATHPTSSAAFSDYDRDGLIDIFVGTFYDGAEGGGSYLYKGRGDGTFADTSEGSKVLRPATYGDLPKFLAGQNRKPAYGVTACDVDDDGDPDFIVSGYGRSWNELWRNDNGVFTEIGQGTPVTADDNMSYKDNEFYRCWCSKNAGKCTPEESMPKIGLHQLLLDARLRRSAAPPRRQHVHDRLLRHRQ